MITIEELDKILDDYESHLQLRLSKPGEHEKYLNMSEDEINKLTAEQCAVGAYQISRYSAWLQKQINREVARVNWSTYNINVLISDQLKQYDKYTPKEEKKVSAVRENDIATKLDEIRQKAQARLDRVSFLPGRLDSVAAALLNVQKVKTYRPRENF